MVGLTLVAVLQNIDVIIVKHQVGGDLAGSWAAVSVAAKAIIWVAIGLAMHLVPDTARRVREGEDPRRALVRSLAIIAVLAIPALAIFAAVPTLLIRVAFGSDLTQASGALLTLGVAMLLLACTYLAVQYQLALGRRAFLGVLALGAALEPTVLLASGVTDPETFAAVVLAVQAATAAAVLAYAARASAGRTAIRYSANRSGPEEPVSLSVRTPGPRAKAPG
jgi:O-antigen/teichoic acid export membrane protein